MDTRLGYFAGIIALIIALFPENNWAKLVLVTIGIFTLLIAFICNRKKESKDKEQSNFSKEK